MEYVVCCTTKSTDTSVKCLSSNYPRPCWEFVMHTNQCKNLLPYLYLLFISSCNVWYGPASLLLDAFLVNVRQKTQKVGKHLIVDDTLGRIGQVNINIITSHESILLRERVHLHYQHKFNIQAEDIGCKNVTGTRWCNSPGNV